MTSIITEKVTFTGALGHCLEAKIDRPEKGSWAVGVYAPCFTCTKDILAATRICTALAEKGITMLRLDFTGQGASEGVFSETNFTTNVNDLLKAIDFLKTIEQTPSLLIGHSLGGTAALVATHRSDAIKAVVTLNSPAQPLHVSRHFKTSEDELLWRGEIEINVAGKMHRIQRHFLDDLRSYTMEDVIKHLNAALLVMHGPDDEAVLIQNASDLFAKALHPKSFVSLADCDHLITQKENTAYVATVISAWIKKYV